ncbi:uncharacterized protein RCC_00152 [Ramularia collo-cygni]|uniref:Mediator of RNA polymerase II transcription subunit 4 n=1 Tax=Ramularia collo-cygni TaxID=112498 RepID=A0A2D3UMQ4_9PEZI|nr:uncharacterized protein RCC_00152 [Ramularia collo-cygni]CZT14178.1 uncharacterized protein RCC_00152 [Ramularia collo-cygni]
MLSQFQASYQRVEASLQKLTDSIAAYNPSVAATDELVTADEAVHINVKQLTQHQKNYTRIQELRQTSESHDETIKNTLRLLAETRKEIQAIPSTDTTEPRREVKVDELLAYAKFIARTTVPPTFRKPLPEDLRPKQANGHAAQLANGMATPPQGDSQEGTSDNPAYVKSGNVGIKAMGETDKAWLVPADLPFEPWPNHDVIMRGALAGIQKMIESGVDPASVLSPEQQAEAERLKGEEEERERKTEEDRAKRRREAFEGYGRRQTVQEDAPFNPDDL